MTGFVRMAIATAVISHFAPVSALADSMTIVSRVSGVVESIEAREGQFVEKGAPLARLDDDLARIAVRKARARVRAAEARELETARHLEREEIMMKRGLIPPSELEDAQTAAAEAAGEAELARAALEEAELNLEYMVVRAPAPGKVIKVHAYSGQVIRLDVELSPLFEITRARED
ncbi:MAG: efflux RND transporter periplasmic adaptor subunit [Candidatus Nitrospinota bacterium M3_3B_026]